MRGRLVVTADGAYVDADETALGLLGLSIDELRRHSIGDLAGPHADVARSVWHRYASRRRALPTGEASIHPPGRPPVRVRYDAVEPTEDGRYVLDFQVVPGGSGPPIVDDLHAVLAEWRATEREVLERGAAGAAAGTEAEVEADGLRRLYGLGSAAKGRSEVVARWAIDGGASLRVECPSPLALVIPGPAVGAGLEHLRATDGREREGLDRRRRAASSAG